MSRLIKQIDNERGVTSVIITLSLIAIFAFTALVIDVGLLFIERNKLVNAADAAALAGAQELPGDGYKAKQAAIQYAIDNGVPPDNIKVTVNISKTEIRVEVCNKVQFLFAKVIGLNEGNVNANTIAIIGPIAKVYDGVRPLAVEDQPLNYGQQVVLKEGAGDGSSGNYGAIALGGQGASNYENYLKYGYDQELRVGDTIKTETGNMAGSTYKGVKYITNNDPSTFDSYGRDSQRVWIIPIVDSLDVSGRDYVTIVGFAAFFVEDVVKQSGHTEITGRFIRFSANGDIDNGQTDYGFYGIKLAK